MKKLKLWWHFDGRYLHKTIQYGIQNLIKWFPIIWQDRDWDYTYIYNLLQFKLEKQSKHCIKYALHTTSESDAQIMATCARLIEKIKEEFYETEYIDYFESEIVFGDIENSTSKTMEVNEVSENFEPYFAKYPRIYKQVMADENPEFLKINKKAIAMNMASINQQRAEKLLFKILKERIRGWWS